MSGAKKLAQIIDLQAKQISQSKLSYHKKKNLWAIKHCRTEKLGGHKNRCKKCNHTEQSYNSCRNRHCPTCGGSKSKAWVEARAMDLLPCRYAHVVFTLPHELNPLALYRPKQVYNALFSSVWQTIHQFSNEKKYLNAKTGMIAVLHTWGQQLSLHPHLHCIIPMGGVNSEGKWKKPKSSFLFPVKAMSKVFRAIMVKELREAKLKVPGAVFKKPWVVYTKQPFAKPDHVIRYLSKYTHRIAISNQRINSASAKKVNFSYKDYRTNKYKTMDLHPREFIRRFSQHILPKYFMRIRHYGILSSTWKRKKLKDLQKKLKVKLPGPKPKYERKCPVCKTPTLVIIERFLARGPPNNLSKSKCF